MSATATDEVRLAEYASLRQEANQRAAIQQALVALNLTVAAAITGFVASDTDRQELFVVVALASSTFGLLWLDHHLNIHEIAGYVKDELWIWEPSWERYIRDHEKPRWWKIVYVAALMFVFVAVAVGALIISCGDADWPIAILWWLGVGLTAITTGAFFALFLRGPARVK